MNKTLKLLLARLFPGIEGEADDVDLPDDPAASDPGVDPVDDLDELDLPDDPPVRAAPRRDDSADRLAKLEAEFERRTRVVDEARRAAPPVDPQFDDDERKLRDPNTSDLEKWQIQSNRTIRATEQRATQALAQAQDIADRARFEAKINSEPRRAKYTDRVEEEIQRARSRGQQASREDVYYWMLGKDIADGKLKPKSKGSASAPAVPRGKPAGVRSDVQGRGRPTSERDKLRSRLENTNI